MTIANCEIQAFTSATTELTTNVVLGTFDYGTGSGGLGCTEEVNLENDAVQCWSLTLKDNYRNMASSDTTETPVSPNVLADARDFDLGYRKYHVKTGWNLRSTGYTSGNHASSQPLDAPFDMVAVDFALFKAAQEYTLTDGIDGATFRHIAMTVTFGACLLSWF